MCGTGTWSGDSEGAFINVIESTPQISRPARWGYGRHPMEKGLRPYIENDEMYLLMDRDTVAGMVAIVMHQRPKSGKPMREESHAS